jgi:GT2 family glycosyltransferase
MAAADQHGDDEQRGARVRAHVVVPTHTPRHLDLCLASLGRQRTLPATVVVTVDGEVPEVEAEARAVWGRLDPGRRPTLVITMRPHGGVARLNQVRNNGLRALDDLGLTGDDLVIMLDGDTMLAADAIERHSALAAAGADVIVPFRVNLTEETTARLSLDDLLPDSPSLRGGRAGLEPAQLVTEADRLALQRRHRRYHRQLALKRIPGLVKPHKPKVLGGHHAVRACFLRAVNGYDEQYTGYGFDDDDLTRRLHQLRPRPRTVIAVSQIMALHLWHPSRAPARPEDSPGAARFARREVTAPAERGWASPASQGKGRVVVIAAE